MENSLEYIYKILRGLFKEKNKQKNILFIINFDLS